MGISRSTFYEHRLQRVIDTAIVKAIAGSARVRGNGEVHAGRAERASMADRAPQAERIGFEFEA